MVANGQWMDGSQASQKGMVYHASLRFFQELQNYAISAVITDVKNFMYLQLFTVDPPEFCKFHCSKYWLERNGQFLVKGNIIVVCED